MLTVKEDYYKERHLKGTCTIPPSMDVRRWLQNALGKRSKG